jgi:5'-phosphate synthase pdxT subunit
MRVGVLGLQGDFEAHGRLLERLGATVHIVKKPLQLGEVSGLVIPGGESTTLIRLMDLYDFWEPLRAFSNENGVILGTCAGMILLAAEVLNPPQKSLGLIDLTVERNSYGRQRESFEATGSFCVNGHDTPLPMVFIRAPRIRRVGAAVESLATCGDDCVLARENRVIAGAFHPELTDDPTVHQYFIDLVDSK